MTARARPHVSGDPAVAAGVRATYVAFIGMGFGAASWAARIPQIRASLGLSPATLGFVLLCVALGSVVSLPMSGAIVHHFTSRRTVAAMAVVFAAGLALATAGTHLNVVVLGIGFFVLGFANGAWDVAMNVQGAIVERRLGRAILPRFHAGYSVGAVTGALIGVAMVALGVPVTLHLLATAGLIAVAIPFGVRRFVPDAVPDAEPNTEPNTQPAGAPSLSAAEDRSGSGLLRRWAEPRTLLIGLFVLSFALAEGTGNDWISLALVDGYHLPAALGTLGYAIFLTSMTVGRWFGTAYLDRHGRAAVVRALALTAVGGLALFIFSPVAPLAFLGAALWGVGASLGFPVGLSAASDEPSAAAGRVSVVTSIGYCAFLGGPPLIGFLGAHVTVLRALTVVAVLLAASPAVTGALTSAAHPPAGPVTEGDSAGTPT